MTGIGPHLERLGLVQYVDALIGEGFDSWETLLDIQEGDLEKLNVKLGHRRKLQRAIAEYRGYSRERPLGSPAQEVLPEIIRSSEGQQNLGSVREGAHAPAQEAKRKYRRHPKADENAPEKPPSAYVIFSNRVREEVKAENLSFTEIARLVGDRWQRLDPSQKETFEFQASALKETYNAQLSNYKKTDSFKEYSQYLNEFRVKHGQQPESKRPKLEMQSSGGSLSAASAGEATEALPPSLGHTRGNSISSLSMTSYGGTPVATVSSISDSIGPAGRLMASMTGGGGSPPGHFVPERRMMGHLSSHSSISEESIVNRGEMHDPLSRTATLSLSTPPASTPPSLPTASSLPDRQGYTGTADASTWSHRYPSVGQHLPTMTTLTGSPQGPVITLPSATTGGEGWRDRGSEGGRPMHHPVGFQPPSQIGSLPLTHLLVSERLPDLSHSQAQRTLPPLRSPLTLGGLPLGSYQSITASAQVSQQGTPEASQLQQGTAGRSSLNRSESEAADTLAELAGQRGQASPMKRSSDHRRKR